MHHRASTPTPASSSSSSSSSLRSETPHVIMMNHRYSAPAASSKPLSRTTIIALASITAIVIFFFIAFALQSSRSLSSDSSSSPLPIVAAQETADAAAALLLSSLSLQQCSGELPRDGKATHRFARDMPCYKRAVASLKEQQDKKNDFVGGGIGGTFGALTLDLSNCDISSCHELASLIGGLVPSDKLRARVTVLDLNNNALFSQLPIDLMRGMKMLNTLFLTGNKFEKLPPGLSSLRAITRLSFKSNLLATVDAAAELPRGLLHLILTDNKLTEVRNLAVLKDLRKLMLAGNQLTELDPIFAPFCALNAQLRAGDDADNNNGVAAIAVRYDNTRVIRSRGEKARREQERALCSKLESLELVRLARNEIPLSKVLHAKAMRDWTDLPKLKWLSLAANPLSNNNNAPSTAVADTAANAEMMEGVPDVTRSVRKCRPKSLGGGASGIVVKCEFGGGPVIDDYSTAAKSKSKKNIVVLKFFKAISSDGGDRAEIAAIKTLMRHHRQHGSDNSGMNRLLLPFGLADFGVARNTGAGDTGNLNVCEDFPGKKCPSRYAAVFPLLPGHPLATPPDIQTITADQYPIALYTQRRLWDPLDVPVSGGVAMPHHAGAVGGGEQQQQQDDAAGEGIATVTRSPISCLTYHERFQIVRDVVEGVAAMHHAGVIHGDVYAHNIFAVNEGGSLRGKLMDFGASFSIIAPHGDCNNDNAAVSNNSSANVLMLPCTPIPPTMSRFEGHALAVFAEEMLDRRRIPLCKTTGAFGGAADKLSPVELQNSVERENGLVANEHVRHFNDRYHKQQQTGRQQHHHAQMQSNRVDLLERLSMAKLSRLVEELKHSSLIVDDILHLPALDLQDPI